MCSAGREASEPGHVTGQQGRLEFRCFGEEFAAVEAYLEALAGPASQEFSAEIYLLSQPPALDRNIKIRQGRLECKILVECLGDLQRWQPQGDWGFPVSPHILGRLFATPFLKVGQWRAPDISRDQLLSAVSAGVTGLRRANVLKHRRRFVLRACRVETDWVLINGAGVASVAIEAMEAGCVERLRGDLGLPDVENVSFPLVIARVLGLSPLRDEDEYGR